MLNPEHRSLYASAARTATVTGDDQVNLGHKGIHLVVDVTAGTAGFSITPKLQGKDANGIYYDILVGAAITATGTNVLKLFPGATPVANATADDHLPPVWRVIVTAADSKSVTYSVGASLLAG